MELSGMKLAIWGKSLVAIRATQIVLKNCQRFRTWISFVTDLSRVLNFKPRRYWHVFLGIYNGVWIKELHAATSVISIHEKEAQMT